MQEASGRVSQRVKEKAAPKAMQRPEVTVTNNHSHTFGSDRSLACSHSLARVIADNQHALQLLDRTSFPDGGCATRQASDILDKDLLGDTNCNLGLIGRLETAR